MRSIILLMLLCSTVCVQAQHSHGGAGVTSLDVNSSDGVLHMLLARSQGDENASLSYLRSSDAGEHWSSPVAVGTGQLPPTAHRGADAKIVARGDHLLAIWTTLSATDRFGRGPMATAISSDGGKTWSAGPNPADDASSSGHAFIAISADRAGTFHLVWLDGRKDNSQPAEAKSGKGLRYAQSRDFGRTWSKNLTLDPATCECCWNTVLARGDSDIHVLYRNRDPRDMAIVSSSDGGATWSKSIIVGQFNWSVDACPHTGGALAGAGDSLISTVWTGNAGVSGAYVLRSEDSGKSWSAPVRLGDASSWHTDAAASSGRTAIVWDANQNGDSAVFAMMSRDGGSSWTSPVRLSEAGVSASHPRVVATSKRFRVFWTESSGSGDLSWRSAAIE